MKNTQITSSSKQKNKIKQDKAYTISMIFLAVIARIMPHPSNMTPMVALSVLGAKRYSVGAGVLVVLVSMLLSNSLLAYMHGYPVFGLWSVASIVGLLVIYSLSFMLRNYLSRPLRLIHVSLLMSFFYWFWLNASTWFLTSLYAKSWHGFLCAQWMGLPFLAHMMLGDIIFIAVSMWLTFFLWRRRGVMAV